MCSCSGSSTISKSNSRLGVMLFPFSLTGNRNESCPCDVICNLIIASSRHPSACLAICTSHPSAFCLYFVSYSAVLYMSHCNKIAAAWANPDTKCLSYPESVTILQGCVNLLECYYERTAREALALTPDLTSFDQLSAGQRQILSHHQ